MICIHIKLDKGRKMPKFPVRVGSPNVHSKENIESFIEMAIEGNPVDKDTVPDRVKNAALLAFIWKDEVLAAISAVKKPTDNYKRRVFEKAGVSEYSSTYSRELGYVQTHTGHRRTGLSGEIVRAIIKKNGSCPVFATTGNIYMAKILESNGFKKIGSEYLARDGKARLSLFVR